MKGRAGCVLERIPHGIADDGGPVGGILGPGTIRGRQEFATVGPGFNVLFRVVPGAAGVIEEQGHQDSGDGTDHEEGGNPLRPEERVVARLQGAKQEADADGHPDGQEARGDHLAKRVLGDDIDAGP